MLQDVALKLDQGDAAIVTNSHSKSNVVVVCEHAGLLVPKGLCGLGLPGDEISSHIGWDPGAGVVAGLLADQLDGALVKQRYSRLVYDCNRPPSSKDAMRAVSEATTIPGNKDLSIAEKEWRIENVYNPFHAAISALLDNIQRPILITIHSFTPIYAGRERKVDIGILHDQDSRLADAMLGSNEFAKNVVVRRNEPYGPQDGVTHTLQRHGLARGILNVMIEIRNDLICDADGQQKFADQLARVLRSAINRNNKLNNREN